MLDPYNESRNTYLINSSMKNIILIIFLFFPLIVLSDNREQNELNLLTWADYIKPEIIKQFEQETGVKVNSTYVDSHYSLEAKIIAINNEYDVTVPSLAPFFMRQVQFNLFQPLNHELLSNYQYIDPKIIAFEKNSNNSNNFAVPFMIDTVGLGYNYNKIITRMPNAPLDSLKLVFDPEIAKNFAECGIELVDSSEEIFALALIYLGLDPNSESQEDLQKASNILNKIRPFIRNINSSLYFNNLGEGDNCLVIGYSGDVVHAEKMSQLSGKNLDIRYILPKEGSILTLDLLAIPVNAPHKENAYKFINFILRPQINAEIANAIGFTSPNMASYPLIRKELIENPNIYPFQHNSHKFYTLKIPNSSFNRLRNRAWMKFLSGEE